MAVVEALCPVWPERPTFRETDRLLLWLERAGRRALRQPDSADSCLQAVPVMDTIYSLAQEDIR